MADQRDKCGCHRGCTMTDHQCPNPCRWPSCLTDEEARAWHGETWPQSERDEYWDGWEDE